jgi:hypothetical protein
MEFAKIDFDLAQTISYEDLSELVDRGDINQPLLRLVESRAGRLFHGVSLFGEGRRRRVAPSVYRAGPGE